MPPTQAHSNAHLHTYHTLPESCLFSQFSSCEGGMVPYVSVCLCLSFCVFFMSACILLSLYCLLFPLSLSFLGPVCLSLSSSLWAYLSLGVSVSVTTRQPVSNTLFSFLAISPCLVVPLPLWAGLDDMESLSHGYVFRHLIMPLADTSGTCFGGERSS